MPLEARAFDLALPRAFAVRPGAEKEPLGGRDASAARKIATALATLGEARPAVRFRAGNARSRAVGKALVDELAALGGGGGEASGGTVLLLDRLDDALSPLVHEYSYQALVQDVLDVQGDGRDRVPYAKQTKGGDKSTDYVMLNERDAIWVEMRHDHVARVVNQLRKRTSDFLARGAGP